MFSKITNPYSFYNKKISPIEEILKERVLLYRSFLKESNPGKANFHIGQLLENISKEKNLISSVVQNTRIEFHESPSLSNNVNQIIKRIKVLFHFSRNIIQIYDQIENELTKSLNAKTFGTMFQNAQNHEMIANLILNKKKELVKDSIKKFKEQLENVRIQNLALEEEYKSLNQETKQELLFHIITFFFEKKFDIKAFFEVHKKEMKVTWDDIKWPTVVSNACGIFAAGISIMIADLYNKKPDINLIEIISLIGVYIGGYGFWAFNVDKRIQESLFLSDLHWKEKIFDKKKAQALFTEFWAFASFDVPMDTVTFIPLFIYNTTWISNSSEKILGQYSDLAPIVGVLGAGIIGTVVWLIMFIPVYPVAKGVMYRYVHKPIGSFFSIINNGVKKITK